MPNCWKMRSHLGKFYGTDDDTDFTVTEIPPPPCSNTRIIEGFDSGGAGNTVFILLSTIAEQIGIDVDGLLTANERSLSGVNSLVSLSILRALRESTGLTVLRNSTLEKMSLDDLEKRWYHSQKHLLQMMLLQEHKPSLAPSPR